MGTAGKKFQIDLSWNFSAPSGTRLFHLATQLEELSPEDAFSLSKRQVAMGKVCCSLFAANCRAKHTQRADSHAAPHKWRVTPGEAFVFALVDFLRLLTQTDQPHSSRSSWAQFAFQSSAALRVFCAL
jgi:hypothetical protein